MKIFEVKTLFGNRELFGYELVGIVVAILARGILEEMYNSEKLVPKLKERLNLEQVPNFFAGKRLEMFIALKKADDQQQHKAIVEAVGEKLIELF